MGRILKVICNRCERPLGSVVVDSVSHISVAGYVPENAYSGVIRTLCADGYNSYPVLCYKCAGKENSNENKS
jgi:hypothetical protein